MSLELLPVDPAAAGFSGPGAGASGPERGVSGDEAGIAALLHVAEAARMVDGADPFDEQARLDLASGRRHGLLVVADRTGDADVDDASASGVVSGGESGGAGAVGGAVIGGAAIVGSGMVGAVIGGAAIVGAAIVGAAIVGAGAIDLVIVPERRREGFGGEALTELLRRLPGPVSGWSHGDHPAAKALADRHGFDKVRTLLQLELRLPADGSDAEDAAGRAAKTDGSGADQAVETDGIRIDTFRAGRDDEEWVALNARVFAEHPEQGGVTLADLHDRMAEPWFESEDFLVARDESGRMVGYNWLKIESSAKTGGDGEIDDGEIDDGEIYVIGVDSAASGRGLGRVLMSAGLRRLDERGCAVATLYVEGDNARALGLYRSFGFTDRSVDAQYRRS